MKKAKETKNNFYPLLSWDIYCNEYMPKIKEIKNNTTEQTLMSIDVCKFICNKYRNDSKL